MGNEKKNGKNVLIVEDDFFVSDIYQTKFKQEGFEVTAAFDGADALDRLKRGLIPDIVLLDIIMPNMDGREFLKEMKTLPNLQSVPVLILSNLSQKEDVDEGLGLGANEYIVKSNFTPAEVFAKAMVLLEKQKA